MSDEVRSAQEKARELLRCRDGFAGSRHAVHRALLVDNGERGSAQKAATFDADDLSALLMDLREVEAKNDLLREANFALVADLSALQLETSKDSKRLRGARAEVKALREEGASTLAAMESIRVDAEQRSKKAQKELYRQNVRLRADVERLRSVLRQLSKDGRVWVTRESLVDALMELADLKTCSSELERVAQLSYSKGWFDRDGGQDDLTALRQRHAEVVKRLEAWARSNDEERGAGKPPTFLNPHTVLLWMGEAKAALERREP